MSKSETFTKLKKEKKKKKWKKKSNKFAHLLAGKIQREAAKKKRPSCAFTAAGGAFKTSKLLVLPS